MIFRSIFTLAVILGLSTSSMAPAIAATTTTRKATKAAAKPAVDPAVALENLRTKGTKEIDRRLTLLNNGFDRLKVVSKISPDNLALTIGQVQAEAAVLTALKPKIAEEKDLAAMREHIKALNDEYAKFRVVFPKMMLTIADNSAAEAGARLVVAATKLKALAEQAELQGKNVSAANTAYTEIEQQLVKANTDYQEIDKALAGISFETIGTNLAPLSDQKDRLKTLNSNISSVYTSLQKMSEQLKALGYSVSLE